jgi:hypothetical protein
MFFGSDSSAMSTIEQLSQGNDRKFRSHVKGELVRKELLSRRDLLKLYQPPIPKSQMPTCNPFYTKTIIPPGTAHAYQQRRKASDASQSSFQNNNNINNVPTSAGSTISRRNTQQMTTLSPMRVTDFFNQRIN